jgi:hypothetical protein
MDSTVIITSRAWSLLNQKIGIFILAASCCQFVFHTLNSDVLLITGIPFIVSTSVSKRSSSHCKLYLFHLWATLENVHTWSHQICKFAQKGEVCDIFPNIWVLPIILLAILYAGWSTESHVAFNPRSVKSAARFGTSVLVFFTLNFHDHFSVNAFLKSHKSSFLKEKPSDIIRCSISRRNLSCSCVKTQSWIGGIWSVESLVTISKSKFHTGICDSPKLTVGTLIEAPIFETVRPSTCWWVLNVKIYYFSKILIII